MNQSHDALHILDMAMPLAEMSAHQIAALPAMQLQEAQGHLLSLQALVKTVLDRLNAALEHRYGPPAAQLRLATGKEFGICHLVDGDLRITADLPKKVVWDQEQLTTLASRIVAAGEKIEDYLDVEYHVPESRFNAWPSTLRSQFSGARAVKAGKAAFRLSVLPSADRG